MTRIALSSLFVLGLVACGSGNAKAPDAKAPMGEHHKAPATGQATGPLVAPGEAKPGDKTTCPVSGEEFVVDGSSPHVEHEGKTYYFCCSGCDKRFKADPAKFLKTKS